MDYLHPWSGADDISAHPALSDISSERMHLISDMPGAAVPLRSGQRSSLGVAWGFEDSVFVTLLDHTTALEHVSS